MTKEPDDKNHNELRSHKWLYLIDAEWDTKSAVEHETLPDVATFTAALKMHTATENGLCSPSPFTSNRTTVTAAQHTYNRILSLGNLLTEM